MKKLSYKKFAANKSLQVCHDNILVLDQFVTLKKKIRAAHALLAAVEHSSDAIEILDPMTSTVQYVNPTHDRNFGDMKPQLPRDAKTFIQRAGGEGSWQGESSFQIKGKNLRYQCYVQTAGGGQHLVTLRRPIFDQYPSPIASNMADLRRRDSLTTRIHTQSVMHDAPILKVSYLTFLVLPPFFISLK
ncbi:DgyrCDS2844 [Dimorphilus gyrociliatus]|uniref:DgyrCDS2844 n=1 Tax=Dimorphilus gyrociliatus TaxID=2664684 RepID=A0A7I8VD98_9ANNE|nr:DgyrCDS2844 [Dimorphilus gyrociliatus]